MIKCTLYMCVCWFLLYKFKYSFNAWIWNILSQLLSTFCAILYSPTHLCRLLRGTFQCCCNPHTSAMGYVWKEQKNLIGMSYNYRNYAAMYGRSHLSAKIRNSDHMKESNTTQVRVQGYRLRPFLWCHT